MREMLLAASVAALTACAQADGDAAVDAPRAPDGATPDAEVPDAAPDAEPPDAMTIDAAIEARSFTDDAFADFQGAAASEAVVEGWGAIAPVAYYTGGLLQRGSDAGYFTDGTTATWTDVLGYTATGRAAIAWHGAASWATDTPPSVGLTDGDFWTQWFEGEIWLEAGAWTFYLLVDDHGFVEIAAPGTTDFVRVTSANWPDEASGTFTAAAAGWHPFRFAIAEQQVDALYQLRFAGPGVAAQVVPRHRFRARVDALQGMLLAGFDDARGVGDVDTTIDAIGPANTGWGTGNPGDLGMTAADTFSVRWTGQFRIDVAGTYTFRYVTDDGQRLWIDGIKVLDTWSPGDVTANNVTGGITLAPGWHDLVVEQTEQGGGASAVLTVESGPELAGQPLPVFRLRPVEGRADRLSAGVNRTDVAIPDVSTVSSSVAVTAPSNAVVTSVDLAFQFTHTYKGDMTFRLRAPNGQEVTVVDFSGDPGGEPWTERYVVTGFTAAPAGGTWTLYAQDAASADTGTLLDVEISPHWSGGEPPIPPASWWESSVRDLGDGVVSIDTVSWAERLPTGADLAVRVRTCAAPPDCASAAWSTPLTTSGGNPGVPAARYLQYRVDLTSDGDHAPALESLTVDYRVAL